MGADFRASLRGMLEVLDPAQNSSFPRHYIDLRVRLSDVLFIDTATILDPSRPLQDRMEVIELPATRSDENLTSPRSTWSGASSGPTASSPRSSSRRRGAEGDHREYTRFEGGGRRKPRARDRTVARKIA